MKNVWTDHYYFRPSNAQKLHTYMLMTHAPKKFLTATPFFLNNESTTLKTICLFTYIFKTFGHILG